MKPPRRAYVGFNQRDVLVGGRLIHRFNNVMAACVFVTAYNSERYTPPPPPSNDNRADLAQA